MISCRLNDFKSTGICVGIATEEIIITAFEQVAETAGDITESVFRCYFEQSSDSAALMDHMDKHMLGRMMDQVLLLLMESGDTELASYLEFETKVHKSYGVEMSMYQDLMWSVCQVVGEVLDTDFHPDVADAFEERIGFLLREIENSGARNVNGS